MLVISLSLLHKTRDTPSRVNREFSKSFDMNNWHLLRKGEKLQQVKESGKRIFGLATDGKKGVHFFGKGCCKKCAGVKQQRKRRLKKLVKS
jgi:hypothetical protein